jgi:hypothetical protein
MVALFLVENFKEGFGKPGPHLGRRPAQIEQPITSIVKDGHSAPALRLRFGLVKHEWTLHGQV